MSILRHHVHVWMLSGLLGARHSAAAPRTSRHDSRRTDENRKRDDKLVVRKNACIIFPSDRRANHKSTIGITLEERNRMLVEGGYLHSMKKMLERAAETPDPTPARKSAQARDLKASRALVQSIKRLFRVLGL